MSILVDIRLGFRLLGHHGQHARAICLILSGETFPLTTATSAAEEIFSVLMATPSAKSGGPVVLLGFPTALDAILARAGAETLQSIATATRGEPKQVMEELARRHLIRPVTTQGHIGDVLPDKIVYDAQTTSGGSGGPLFNNEGKVIGINFAMVREFGGSNFDIPVGYGKSLLKR